MFLRGAFNFCFCFISGFLFFLKIAETAEILINAEICENSRNRQKLQKFSRVADNIKIAENAEIRKISEVCENSRNHKNCGNFQKLQKV